MYRDGYLAEANDAMAAMYGLKTGDELKGARLSDLFVQDDPKNTAYLEAFIASGYKLSGVVSHEKDHEGNDKYFRNSLIGIVHDGFVYRAWGTQQDVTDQTHTMEALQRSEERLSQALEASHLGLWEWDIATDKLSWSDRLREIYGVASDTDISLELYLGLIHPADRDVMRHVIDKAIKTRKPYVIEHRIIRPDGSEHWVMSRGKATYETKTPIRMIGTCMLIDDQKENERYIRESERLEAANALLKTQQLELMQLNQSKDEFISLASHQLRTPATGVKQYIGLLLDGYAGDITDQQQQYLQVAYESNERQLHIVDDLLRVAHVDAGKVVLKHVRTDLVSLINDVINELQGTISARRQTIAFDHKKNTVYADVDPYRLRMVIENLVDNASKYTPEKKQISLSITQSKQTIISVKDTGVGIAKKDIDKLFHKFSRIDNSLSTKVGGTGIGLYWARRIIDLHGGKIEVESKLNKGTVFRLILPR